MRRLLVPLLFGLLGTGILVSLGVWQLQRLAWKTAILSEIDQRIAGAPGDLPAQPDHARDEYMPVLAEGVLSGPELHVLVGAKGLGAGYRLIQAFQTGGRRIMVDRGFIPVADVDAPRPGGPARLLGNLHWPEEVDSFTPDPEKDKNIWFARAVPAMAAALGTEPVLLVVRQQIAGPPGGNITPLPVDSAGIPNDHLQYAITWFSLAAIWLAMTGYLLWRQRWPAGARKAKAKT